MKLPTYLALPLLTGAVLRLGLLPFSNHIYYPDELYQTLEPAFGLVYGYSLQAWDLAHGLRSYIPALLLTLPLWLTKIFGLTDPTWYIQIVRAFISLTSLLIVVAVGQVCYQLTQSAKTATFAAFTTAVWYELIYLTSRPFSETVSLWFIALAAILALNHRTLTTCISLILGLLLRPQFLPLVIPFIYLTKPKTSPLKLIGGLIIGISLYGLIDLIFLQTPFISFYNNVNLSYLSGISAIFGTQPWWYYLASLSITSFGLWFISLISLPLKSVRPLWLSLFGLLLLHSLIPHKEYRFILPAIPLAIILTSISLHKLHQPRLWPIAATLVILISCLGFIDKLPGQSQVYGQPPLLNDPLIGLYHQLHRETQLCGIYDASRNWIYTPSYVHLNQPAYLYSADYPPPNPDNISHYISPYANLNLAGFKKITTTASYRIHYHGQETLMPGYSLYAKLNPQPCALDPSYSPYRSFPEVEHILSRY